MSSCPIESQPPDIEELCINKMELTNKPQRKRTMTLQDRELRNTAKTSVRGLPRSFSDMNVVAICTCQQSKDFPFCDNTHTIFNKATNSNMSPLYVAFVEGSNCSDCGSNVKDKDKLSHSMDNQSFPTNRGCSVTPSNPTSNKLQHSADGSSCFCKQSTKFSNIQTSNDLQLNTSTKPRPIKPTSRSTTPTPISIPSALVSTTPPNPIQNSTIYTSETNLTNTLNPPNKLEQTQSPILDTPATPTTSTRPSISITPTTPTSPSTPITPTNTPIKCNNTKVYTPSSSKDPCNQYNIITREEVAEHATHDDLWMIIKGSVYDITDYVQYHPGGVRALVKFAGKDGTENVHYHSSKMLEILNSHYFIGKLPKHQGGGGGGCIIS